MISCLLPIRVLHKKVIKSVIRRCGRTGNPPGFSLTKDQIPKPMKHREITEETLAEDGPAAALQETANRIAESLSLGIAFHRDRAWARQLRRFVTADTADWLWQIYRRFPTSKSTQLQSA